MVARVYQIQHVDSFHFDFMSFIEEISIYLFICLGFIAITCLAWISSHVEQTSHRHDEDLTYPSTNEQSPYLTEYESDIDSSEIEDLSDETNQSLRITIKFLNETQKSLLVQSNDKISKIKRLYLADQLTNNQIIRLIYQGRELRDSRTLRMYNIRNETIIHCLITTRHQSITNSIDENSNTFDIDTSPIRISCHFIIFLTFIFAFIWYLRVEYRLLFTPVSTIVLLVITIVFFIFTCGPFLSQSREHIHLN